MGLRFKFLPLRFGVLQLFLKKAQLRSGLCLHEIFNCRPDCSHLSLTEAHVAS